MKIALKILPLLLVLFLSCRQSKFLDYSRTNTDLLYKFLTVGDDNYYPRQNDSVTVHLQFKDKKGKPVDSQKIANLSGIKTFQLTDSVKNGGLEEAISMMNLGDSASFIIPSATFYKRERALKYKDEELFFVNAKLLNIIAPVVTKPKPAPVPKKIPSIDFESWQKQQDNYENTLFTNYIKENNINVPQERGIYYIETEEGKGELLLPGDTVYLHYIGRFLDGTVFDNTYKTEPFEFTYGVYFQLIRGMEIGISKMKRGGKAKFIIPSHLAFGENGSSTGIVPPNTTVIFEVELINK